MGRPKINPEDKRNKPISVYVTQELRDDFTAKIQSDTNIVAKQNLNAVINKLIYDYTYNNETVSATPSHTVGTAMDGLSATEQEILTYIFSSPIKKKRLFDMITDSKTLSN